MTSVYVASYKTAKGTRYRVMLKRGKKATTLATGLTSERIAEDLARKARLEAQKVRAGVVKITPLVRDVVDAYVATLEGEWAKNARRYADNDLLPALGHLELGELRRGAVVDLAETLRARIGAQTTKHVVGILRAAIFRAIDREEFAGANPAQRIKVAAGDVRVAQVLRPEEFEAVLAHVRIDVRDYVGLTLALAARPKETLNLQRVDVDVAQWQVLFTNTKTGVDRVAVVPAYARGWLLRAVADAGESPWLFPLARTTNLVVDRKLTSHLREAMRRAIVDGCTSLATSWDYWCHNGHRVNRLDHVDGLRCVDCERVMVSRPVPRDVKFREVRHSGGSFLVEGGMSFDDVAAQMGNDPRVLRKHYDRSRPTRRKKQMDNVTLPTTSAKREGA